ncbi:hypothetical protein TNCV_1763781 [Trichonephila clavipes]|nr:hypothetical protein TNCV_1763781 [Trichonephila clavipes]
MESTSCCYNRIQRITLLKFRIQVIQQLFKKNDVVASEQKNAGRLPTVDNPARLSERHFISHILPTAKREPQVDVFFQSVHSAYRGAGLSVLWFACRTNVVSTEVQAACRRVTKSVCSVTRLVTSNPSDYPMGKKFNGVSFVDRSGPKTGFVKSDPVAGVYQIQLITYRSIEMGQRPIMGTIINSSSCFFISRILALSYG